MQPKKIIVAEQTARIYSKVNKDVTYYVMDKYRSKECRVYSDNIMSIPAVKYQIYLDNWRPVCKYKNGERFI